MKKTLLTTIITILFCFNSKAQCGSGLARLTGICVDLTSGSVAIQAPNINAVPEIVRNLPKDVGQALLNPLSPVLAAMIRASKAQALARGTQPIPLHIKQQLSKYFPANILESTTWTTANGISIDGMLKNWLNQEGAVTFDNVICFSSNGLSNNVELWAHELTHVLQYNGMGVETFAFYYSIDWNSLENQASDNASKISQNIALVNNGSQPAYQYNTAQIVAPNQLSWGQINNYAKQVISPADCIWVNNQNNTTGNKCPCSIMVTGVVMKRLSDGFVTTMPCNEQTCLFPAGQSGPLISPYGYIITGVTAAYEYK